MKKIYIAGKVTGENQMECVYKFAEAQKCLEDQGFEAVNPLEVVGDWETPWTIAMTLCLAALKTCDGILMLPDHIHSRGANIEMVRAIENGLPVFQNYNDISFE